MRKTPSKHQGSIRACCHQRILKHAFHLKVSHNLRKESGSARPHTGLTLIKGCDHEVGSGGGTLRGTSGFSLYELQSLFRSPQTCLHLVCMDRLREVKSPKAEGAFRTVKRTPERVGRSLIILPHTSQAQTM